MAAHALHPTAPKPAAAPHLRLVVSRGVTVWAPPPPLQLQEPAMSATLKRCLLLALLLHVWLVLVLGNAPGGTAAPGQGVAGSLNITLQGPPTPGATEEAAPPAPVLPEGARGSAALPRWGGAVREQAVPPAATPGAAQLGRWAATPQPATAPEVPAPPPGRVVQEQPLAEAAVTPRPAPLEPPMALLPEPAPAPLPAAAPELAAMPVPAPERRLARSAAPPAPNPAAVPELAAALLLQPSASPVLPDAAPLPQPAALTPRLARPAPTAAAELPVLAPLPGFPQAALAPLPAPLPAPLAVPIPTPVPTPVPAPEALWAPASAAPAAVPVEVPAAVPAAAPTDRPAARPSALPAALPGTAAPSPNHLPAAAFTPGAPDAGSRVGADVATPPSAAASVPQRLNLQLSRPRGGELSRGRSAGALPVLPRPPEVDEKLGRDIAKSVKPDCREAYRSAGLLAVVPLAAQALKADAGCKW